MVYRIAVFIFAFVFMINQNLYSQKYKISTIGFYNFENLFDTIDTHDVSDTEFTPAGSKVWNTAKYEEKVSNMAYIVSQLGTDFNPKGVSLLGVSEVENDTVVRDVINHPFLKDRNYDLVHVNSKDERGIDVALIYQKDAFKVTNYDMYTLPIIRKGEIQPTRDVLLVSGLLDGEPVHILVNHWPSRRGGEKRTEEYRMKGAQICKSIIDSIRVDEPDVKAFVVGDMNDNPSDKSVSGILKGLDNKSKVKGDAMYNPMLKMYKKGLGSNAYQDTWSLFDQILMTEATLKDKEGFFFHEAVIFNKKYMQTPSGRYKGYPKRTFSGDEFIGGYSDHFPVYVHLLKTVD